MRSAKTFNGSGWRPPRLENGKATARERKDEGATGVPAARTRIRAIASRRRIVPSARGPRKSRAIPNHAIADRGTRSPRPRTIGRGRRNPPGLARSGNRGQESHPAVRDGLENLPAPRLARIGRGTTSRVVAAAEAAFTDAATNPRADRRVVRHGGTGRPAAAGVPGQAAQLATSASRSCLAAARRVRDSTNRLARSGTTIRIGTRRLMISHVVLMKPRPDLSPDERQQFIDAFEKALTEIPGVRGVRVGDRVLHGAGYEQSAPAMDFIAVIDFDDVDGLQAYLRHPAHEQLAACFRQSLTAALVYDFQVGGVEELRTGRFS